MWWEVSQKRLSGGAEAAMELEKEGAKFGED
jgi:hypothetical protein